MVDFPKNKKEKFISFFEQAKKTSQTWRNQAKESYGFVEGYSQWEESDKNELKRQNRPALVMNAILPVVNLISGQERTSRLGITFKPRGLDDDKTAMIANSAFKYMQDKSELVYEVSNSFQDMVICGRGYIYTGIDFSNIEDPTGEISIKRINPLSVFVDPSYSRYNMQDAKYVIYSKWVSEDELRLRFTDAMKDVRPGEWLGISSDLIGEKTLESSWKDTRKGQVRLLEIWYKVPKKVFLVITQSGEVQKFSSRDEASDAISSIRSLALERNAEIPDFDIVERIIWETRVADVTYWKILRDRKSPYKHNKYPIIPFVGYNFDEKNMGVVESLKDPQREKNKRWSQMLHIINTMSKSGWKIPKDSVSPSQLAKWATEAGKPGFWFEYNPRVGEPREIQGQNIPGSFVQLMQISEDEIRKTSGAIQELLGIARAPDQSGKALGILQNSGATILSPLFDNLVRSQKLIGEISISLIKQYYTPEKIFDILGADEKQNIDQDVISFIEKSMSAKFDVIIDITPLIGSERDRQFNQVVELLKIGLPPSAQLLELLLEVSDFPNKDRYLQELKANQQQQQQQ